jgi:hypothetical protein
MLLVANQMRYVSLPVRKVRRSHVPLPGRKLHTSSATRISITTKPNSLG